MPVSLEVLLTRIVDTACELTRFEYRAILLSDQTVQRLVVVGPHGLSDAVIMRALDGLMA